MRTPYTHETLIQDFTHLGIVEGDTLFIHSSFKSLGPVQGGASTVISALEAAVGGEGLILMPTFSLLPSREERVAAWNVNKTPSTVGWLTSSFDRCPTPIAPTTIRTPLPPAGKMRRRSYPIISAAKATSRRGIIIRGARLTARTHRCSAPTMRTPNSL